MQDKKGSKVKGKLAENTQKKEISEEETIFLSEILAGKGVEPLRVKRKVYDEIKLICDEDHLNKTEFVSTILATHIYNLKKRKGVTP